MAKKIKLLDWLFKISAVVASVGIGGLFLNGTFLNTFLLKLLPSIVHTIVGWVLIVSAFLMLFKKFF